MPKSLLDSQLATLEPPAADERAVTVSVEPPVEAVVEAVVARCRRSSRRSPPSTIFVRDSAPSAAR